jgi:SAM-dependent methyltransferase
VTVHPHANAFDQAAEDYELGRPGYPDALLDWIEARYALGADDTVVDLGAGTGKLTRLLVRSRARVVAVEPMPGMRAVLARLLPGTELVDGTAEAMPLGGGSVRLVACGQSFRWFANAAALTEIGRVLAPAGELLLVFNGEASQSAVQRRVTELLALADTETEEKKPGRSWREVIAADGRFTIVEEDELPNRHVVDLDGLVARLNSSSQFTRLAPSRKAALLAELGELLVDGRADLSQVTRLTRLVRS